MRKTMTYYNTSQLGCPIKHYLSDRHQFTLPNHGYRAGHHVVWLFTPQLSLLVIVPLPLVTCLDGLTHVHVTQPSTNHVTD